MRQQTASPELAQLQQDFRQLEEEVQMLEGVLARVFFSPPILFAMPDGSKRPFRPTRPISLRTLAILLKVEEESQKRRSMSRDEEAALMHDVLERARQEAIEKGIAIDDEREAAIGD